jgi:hypothetical protein
MLVTGWRGHPEVTGRPVRDLLPVLQQEQQDEHGGHGADDEAAGRADERAQHTRRKDMSGAAGPSMASGIATSVTSARTHRTTAANATMPIVSHEPMPIVRNHHGTWNVVISRCAAAATRRA